MSIDIVKAGPARAGHGLVLVHGRGGTAADILGLGKALGIADLALAAPQHPRQSWWPTSFLAPAATLAPFVEAGIAAIDATIKGLVQDGVPKDRISVCGFSQGACLALEYAARKGNVQAVFGLSGGLIGTDDAASQPDPALYGYAEKSFDYQTALSGTSVYIEVHQQDPHIPLARAERSAAVFEQLGSETKLHVVPGAGHSVTHEGVAAMRSRLNI
ncbi:MAG: dienelactone hydrolase family protein [Pseudomonadota bacterium]